MNDLYIMLHTSLASHRKVKMLARRLHVSENESIGLLIHLWLWAQTQRNDGDLSGLTDEELAIICHYEGDADLKRALIDAKWVDADEHIHDWGHYCKLQQNRRNADRQAAAYARRKEGIPPDPRYQRGKKADPDPPEPSPRCPVAAREWEALGLEERIAALVPNSGMRADFEASVVFWLRAYCKAATKKSAALSCDQRCTFCKERLADLIAECERAKGRGVPPGAVVGKLLKDFKGHGRTDLSFLIGEKALYELRALEKSLCADAAADLPPLGVTFDGIN